MAPEPSARSSSNFNFLVDAMASDDDDDLFFDAVTGLEEWNTRHKYARSLAEEKRRMRPRRHSASRRSKVFLLHDDLHRFKVCAALPATSSKHRPAVASNAAPSRAEEEPLARHKRRLSDFYRVHNPDRRPREIDATVDFFIGRGGDRNATGSGLEQLNRALRRTYGVDLGNGGATDDADPPPPPPTGGLKRAASGGYEAEAEAASGEDDDDGFVSSATSPQHAPSRRRHHHGAHSGRRSRRHHGGHHHHHRRRHRGGAPPPLDLAALSSTVDPSHVRLSDFDKERRVRALAAALSRSAPAKALGLVGAGRLNDVDAPGSRAELSRFLFVHKFDAAKSLDAIVAKYRWRRAEKMDTILLENFEPQVQWGMAYVFGRDLLGRPCVVVRISRYDPTMWPVMILQRTFVD